MPPCIHATLHTYMPVLFGVWCLVFCVWFAVQPRGDTNKTPSLSAIRLSGYPVIRLSGYPVIRLSGYPVIRFFGYLVIWLFGYPAYTPPADCASDSAKVETPHFSHALHNAHRTPHTAHRYDCEIHTSETLAQHAACMQCVCGVRACQSRQSIHLRLSCDTCNAREH